MSSACKDRIFSIKTQQGEDHINTYKENIVVLVCTEKKRTENLHQNRGNKLLIQSLKIFNRKKGLSNDF